MIQVDTAWLSVLSAKAKVSFLVRIRNYTSAIYVEDLDLSRGKIIFLSKTQIKLIGELSSTDGLI